MTVTTRKATAMKLEAEYSQLRKQQAYGNANKPSRVMNAAAKPTASPQIDTVTLFSKQADIETPSNLIPSKPVTIAEKTALQYQFSVSA
jgi:hypothetical protein